MSINSAELPHSFPDHPNLRHLKDQAKDLLKTGRVNSLAEAQFEIARLYGFASWPKLKAHVDSLEEIGQLKQAIDSNDLKRVKAIMTASPALHHPARIQQERPPHVGRRMPGAMGTANSGKTRYGGVDDRQRVRRSPRWRWSVDARCAFRSSHPHDEASGLSRCQRERSLERIFSDHLRSM